MIVQDVVLFAMAQPPGQRPSLLVQLLPFVLMAGIFYFIRIPGDYYALGVMFVSFGAPMYGVFPIVMEVLAEVTYPAHQTIR